MAWTDWILILVSACWLFEMWGFRNRRESNDAASEHQSFYIVSVTIVTIFVTSLIMSFVTPSVSTVQRSIALLFFTAGVTLRFWGIFHLGHQFTRHVVVRPTDELTSTGPYRILRHPLYTGLLWITFGFSLYFLNWFFAIICAMASAIALLWRIQIEEKMLVDHFGQTYVNWSKTRKRLFPYLY